MTRHDLHALTDDDLVALSNRGNLNRARRELDTGEFHPTYTHGPENLIVVWTDPVTCVFPHDRPLTDAFCTCPAGHLCRHILRSVLAYQRDHTAPNADVHSGPWDPGAIDDQTLQTVFGPLLATAQDLIHRQLVAELIRSEKPLARLLTLGHTVNFLVRHDLRYAHCDCAASIGCIHAAVATLAFRLLPSDQLAGVITTDDESPSTHTAITLIETALKKIADVGLARTTPEAIDRMRSHAKNLAHEGWVWPADVAHHITHLHHLYKRHDARFAHADLAHHVGEFLIRKDALAAPVLPIPRSFVRGNTSHSDTTLGHTRLIGLGCTARVQSGYVELQALLQDAAHGRVIAVTHRFPDPPNDPAAPPPPTLHELGSRLLIRGRSLANFGAGQIVMTQARLTHTHELDLRHATASTYPQNFKWEELAAPTLVDNFAEVSTRLNQLPPASLRSRAIGENIFVCPVASVDDVHFLHKRQLVTAILHSDDGSRAQLNFPYLHRNHAGAERLLYWLHRHADHLRFVSGTARTSPSGVALEPAGLVFEIPFAGTLRREFVQPWVDSLDDHLERAETSLNPTPTPTAISVFKESVGTTLGTLLLQGIAEFTAWTDLARLVRSAQALKLVGMAHALQRLHQNPDESALLECLVFNTVLQESQ